MKTNSILKGPYQSFYSKTFYREVAREWGSEPFVYLLWVMFLSMGFLSVVLGVQYVKTVTPMYQDILRQVPTIHIVNGRASAVGPQPLLINVHVGNKVMPMAVVDTGDRYKSLEETGAPIWLNSKELVVLNKGEKRTRSLAQMKDTTIDKAWLREKTKWVIEIALAVAVPIVFIFFYGFRLVQALLYAVAGLLWNVFFGARLSFAALWRLSLAAMTPSILLGAVNFFYSSRLHLPGYVFVLLTLAYLAYAVWANIPEEEI